MQEQEPGSSNQELTPLTITGANNTSGKYRKSLVTLALISTFLFTAAHAQENSGRPAHPATPALAPKVINIWPGVAPGSEGWRQKETTIHMGPMESIVNVTTPTLTAYLPDPAKATGTAVIM